MNTVQAYLAANGERLGIERFGLEGVPFLPVRDPTLPGLGLGGGARVAPERATRCWW